MGEELALYLAFGSLAGLLSGLFGIGGGVVIVPFLAWYFETRGFPADSLMIMAVATSLATIIVTTLSAVHAHHRLKAVRWEAVRRLAPGILAGSVLGSVIADHLPAREFKLIFALFLVYVALRMLRPVQAGGRWLTPGAGLFTLAGLGIGAVSAILGIGGGTLSVPFLIKSRFPMHNAVAVSVASGFPIAVAGTLTYLVLGWRNPALPAGSLGYVYLPAFAGIILTSVPFAPLGARLAHRLPTARLRRLFAWVVLMVGGKLLWQAAAPWRDVLPILMEKFWS
jgi:uncharacterized membrane protein YfcA